MSLTVIVNEPVPVFPASSVALHSTVVIPNGNIESEIGVHVGVTSGLTLS